MSDGNNEKVLLDLNYPEFQSTPFDLDINELKKVIKTFRFIFILLKNKKKKIF